MKPPPFITNKSFETFEYLTPWYISDKLTLTHLSLISMGLEGEQSVASCLLPALGDTMVILIGFSGLQDNSSV